MSLVVGHFIVSRHCRGPSIEPNELNRDEDGGSSEYVSLEGVHCLVQDFPCRL